MNKSRKRKHSTKSAASRKAVKQSGIVQPRSYRFGDRVRILHHLTGKPVGKAVRIQKPESGELKPGAGWFLAGDAWSHHTGLIPA